MTRASRRLAVPIVVVALAGLRAPSAAAPTGLVAPPAGWRADPERAAQLAQHLTGVEHFGGLAAVTAAEAYVAPTPGAALFATRVTASVADPAAAARAARAALDELRATTQRSALTGGAATESGWQERVDTEQRQVTATLQVRDPVSHTVESARIVVVSDGKRIAAVTGECLSSEGSEGSEGSARAAAEACVARLASLDPGISPAERVALAPGPAAEPAAATPPAGTAQAAATSPAEHRDAPGSSQAPTMAPADPDAAPRLPSRIGEGGKVVLPPLVIRDTAPDRDRRPLYLGAGLVVLAVLSWWNRRRRDRFEREEGNAPAVRVRRERRRAAQAQAAADPDADDLHAAARGDGDGDGESRTDSTDLPDR